MEVREGAPNRPERRPLRICWQSRMLLRLRVQREIGTVVCIDAEEGQICSVIEVGHRREEQARIPLASRKSRLIAPHPDDSRGRILRTRPLPITVRTQVRSTLNGGAGKQEVIEEPGVRHMARVIA